MTFYYTSLAVTKTKTTSTISLRSNRVNHSVMLPCYPTERPQSAVTCTVMRTGPRSDRISQPVPSVQIVESSAK